MFSTILFDLDGTLTDPGEGITNSVAYALERFGIHIADRKCLYPFIGPPLMDSFSRYYGMSDSQAEKAVEVYREYFSVKGWLENCPYDGICAMLANLRASGKRLLVATSKPEEFAVRILEYFGLSIYFEAICGAPFHPPKGHGKVDVIRDALRRTGISDLRGVIMVGDRRHDIQGAHAAGIPAVGVLYGYGDREEHEACQADYIVEDVDSLEKLLLKEA